MSSLGGLINAQISKAAHLATLMAKRNVIACGVGYKIRQEELTSEPSVMVSVTRKLPVAQLASDDLVPKELDGVPTDVVETGVFRAFEEQRGRFRLMAPPGISIGHQDVTAGTFGCLVRRGNERFILSNNHVLANCNAGRRGDSILQPGRLDGGTDADKIAELADFVPLEFGNGSTERSGCGAPMAQLQRAFAVLRREKTTPSAQTEVESQTISPPNRIDAALARPLSGAMVSAEILKIGVPVGVAQANLGLEVQKSGRTTGYTRGRITQIDVTVQVAYGNHNVLFIDQLMADGMSQPGDSGSAVLDMNRNVVGLLFAGSNNTTLINPIQLVLEALDIEIIIG